MLMTLGNSPHSPNVIFESPQRTGASYERELADLRSTEVRLRRTLACEEALLTQKDALIEQQELLSKESNHRLLNNLQMIVSLLSLQSRASPNAEAASQLAIAADRVATIGRVHRRLHLLDGVQTVAFKGYLEDLCREFSPMVAAEAHPEQVIRVEGSEIKLPTATAIPLAFIVNELLTNAVKHGKGRIVVRLQSIPEKGYALSVSNDGPGLPEGSDLTARKGLGMRIIRSFVKRIGGDLQVGRGDNNEGTRFTVLFARA